MKYAPIQLSSLKKPQLKHRRKSVNYLDGFWLAYARDILKKIPLTDIRSLFKGRFSFTLRWEHVVIAFLLGALLLRGGSTHIVKATYQGVSPAPAIISVKTLPLLKEAVYKPVDMLQPVWISKLRPWGTYDNGYAPLNCTWGVASRLPIPSNWGDANNWAYSATLAGYTVTSTPAAEEIAQTGGDSYLGHVAIVLSLNPDGSFNIWEENGMYGLGTVDERTTTTAEFPNFIVVQ